MSTTTTTAQPGIRSAVWGGAIGVGLLLAALCVTGAHSYPWIALGVFTAAAAAIAVIDVRTKKLPNRYTGPLAVAAALQVTAASITAHNPWIAVQAVGAAAAVFVAYTLMAMAGWCGFGDAKYAAALALFAGIFTGLFAIYIVPIAILISGGERGIRMLAGRGRAPHAHGPSIAAAAVLVTVAGILL